MGELFVSSKNKLGYKLKMKKIQKFGKKPKNSIINRDLDGEIHYIDSFNIIIQNTENYPVDYLVSLLFT